jgi:hypothetical protein
VTVDNDEGERVDPLQQVDDLTASVSRSGLPEEVKENRAAQSEQDKANCAKYEPRIEAQVAAHRLAIDFLVETHHWIADQVGFDLDGETRAAAIWAMSGRCLGIARLMLDGIALGYTAELLHLARAEHEASRLAEIFGTEEGTELLRKWLADEGNEWVRPSEVRKADEAYERRLADAMREAGLDEIPSTTEQSKFLYGEHSQAAHHRRRWTLDAVSPALRTMITGPTDNWLRRAGTAAAMLGVVEECVISIGGCLSGFLPDGWYAEKVKPFLETFRALRQSQPLP